MANKPRWTSQGVHDGIREVHIRRWKNFPVYIQEAMTEPENYIFRGHRKESHRLESTLDRIMKPSSDAASVRDAQLRHFKHFIRGRRGENPPQYNEENEWWALGQHHGLRTPLLDWTESPYVAMYFAFYRKEPDDPKRRVVWGLRKDLDPDVFEKLGIELYTPYSDENGRVLVQNGLFTKTDGREPIEDRVRRVYRGSSDPVLVKMILPNSERLAIMSGLEYMNINHMTLFPDLQGASIHANRKIEEHV